MGVCVGFGYAITSAHASISPLDDVLTFSDVQAKGTHNSYHISRTVFDASHRYTHLPLNEQLDTQGVRQFELDIHYHVEGVSGVSSAGLDAETTCLQFSECMRVVKEWSDHTPHHMPLMIWLELKDDIDELVPELDLLDGRYEALEDAVLEIWPKERIVTPDEVRGEDSTLSEAITTRGWPTVCATRPCRICPAGGGIHRDNYLQGAPTLENGCFVQVPTGQKTRMRRCLKSMMPVLHRNALLNLSLKGFRSPAIQMLQMHRMPTMLGSFRTSLASGAHF